MTSSQKWVVWKARVKFTSGITKDTGVRIFTGGQLNDKGHNGTEVWLYDKTITFTFTRTSCDLCEHVAAVE